jgi:FkbM family methyltransferase
MAPDLSIKLGNFLFRNFFSIYNVLYPVFKRKQDKFEIELLKEHIKPGDVVFDIGANIGFYAKILSPLAGPAGRVHCFEPDTINFKHLVKATKNLPNVILNHNAIGPKTESIKIYTSKDLNVDHRTYKPEEYDQEIDIDAVSIDDYVKGLDDKKVDFIKMDIQGFEMQAIKGMLNTLRGNPSIKMISEFWPYGLRKSGSSLIEYFNYLRELGFNIQLLHDNSLKDLSLEKVKQLEPLGKEYYFNIFITKN